MDEHDAKPPRPHGARRLDEDLAFERQGLALDQAHVARPPDQTERDDRVDDPRPEGADDRQRQHQRRDRQENIRDAHDGLAHRAADVARDDPERHADGGPEHGDDEPDLQRHPRAQDDARVDIGSDLVGAEPVARTRRAELLVQMDRAASVLGIRDDEGAERGHEQEHEHEAESEQRGGAAREDPRVEAKLARRRPALREPGAGRSRNHGADHHGVPAGRTRGSSQA